MQTRTCLLTRGCNEAKQPRLKVLLPLAFVHGGELQIWWVTFCTCQHTQQRHLTVKIISQHTRNTLECSGILNVFATAERISDDRWNKPPAIARREGNTIPVFTINRTFLAKDDMKTITSVSNRLQAFSTETSNVLILGDYMRQTTSFARWRQ